MHGRRGGQGAADFRHITAPGYAQGWGCGFQAHYRPGIYAGVRKENEEHAGAVMSTKCVETDRRHRPQARRSHQLLHHRTARFIMCLFRVD